MEAAVPQCRVRLSQRDHPAIHLLERRARVPRHRAAVFRLALAAKPLLVAVEHARHAGERHLQQHRKLHPLGFPAAEREEPAHIVAVEQVELGEEGVFVIAQQQGGHIRIEGLCVHRLLGKKPAAVAAEIVVHRGVEHVAAEIMRGIFPYLADDERIALRRLDGSAERAQETVVQLVRHVQPPAVHVKLSHPVRADVAEILPEEGVGGVRFRHIGDVRKAGIAGQLPGGRQARRLGQRVEAGIVPRSPPLFQHVAEEGMIAAHMIEYAVENDPDAERVRAADKIPEIVLGAHVRIDAIIIQRIVPVVRSRREDRVQVNAVEA